MARDNHISGLFLKLAQKDYRSAAFRALKPWAKLAMFELDMSYWEGPRENPIVITRLWLAERLGVDPKTAAAAIDDLAAHWFLDRESAGRMTGPLGERGARYRMAWLPTSDGHPAQFDHRNWAPPIAVRNAVKLGASTREKKDISEVENGLRHTKFRSVQNVSAELVAQLQTPAGRGISRRG